MAKDTRQLILDTSHKLFTTYGYTATSMRQIAKACGVSVGNLCYYFKKKEDLLMDYHNELYFTSLECLSRVQDGLEPWCGYIATEYSFLYQCSVPPVRKLYLDVINVPSLRKVYAETHHDIFLRFLSKEQFKIGAEDLFLSTVISSSMEYHLMEQYDAMEAEMDFDHIFSYVFEVRMALLGVNPDKYYEYIERGFSVGKQIAKESINIRNICNIVP